MARYKEASTGTLLSTPGRSSIHRFSDENDYYVQDLYKYGPSFVMFLARPSPNTLRDPPAPSCFLRLAAMASVSNDSAPTDLKANAGSVGLKSGLEMYERDGDERKLPFLLDMTEVKLLGVFNHASKTRDRRADCVCSGALQESPV
jgi:hypothetical protein